MPAPADTTAPTVALTSPAAGATVSGSSVALAATAADNVGVARVEFKVDGTLITSDLSAPYAATWNASSASAGSHTILATAYDAAGNSASSSVSVTVLGHRGNLQARLPLLQQEERLALLHGLRGREELASSPTSRRSTRLDGVASRSAQTYTTPLYRFYNKKNGSHFYTASEAEKNRVLANLSATYTYDGVAYNVSATQVAGSTPVYRFYNKKNGSHFYTASEAEKNSVLATLSSTYSLDGIAFYAVP